MKGFICALVIFCITAPCVGAARLSYSVYSLGKGAVPLGINDSGQIIGMIHGSDGQSKAMLWVGSKGIDIGKYLPGADKWVIDINNSGQVLCQSNDEFYNIHYYIYSKAGVQEVSGLYWAYGIDDHGRVYGGVPGGLNGIPAVWYNGDIDYLPLPDAEVQNCLVFDGCLNGSAVGFTMVDGVSYATLWKDGSPINLNEQGLTYDSYPMALSSNGYTVGYGTIIDGDKQYSTALLWDDQANVTFLGSLGGLYSLANDVNSNRQVVGHAETRRGATHAFLWQKGAMTDLNQIAKTKYVLDDALTISDKGRIGCTGSDRTGRSYGFVLVPARR